MATVVAVCSRLKLVEGVSYQDMSVKRSEMERVQLQGMKSDLPKSLLARTQPHWSYGA